MYKSNGNKEASARELPRTFRKTSAKTTGRFSDAVLPRGSSADVFVQGASAALPRKGFLVFSVLYPSKTRAYLEREPIQKGELGLALKG